MVSPKSSATVGVELVRPRSTGNPVKSCAAIGSAGGAGGGLGGVEVTTVEAYIRREAIDGAGREVLRALTEHVEALEFEVERLADEIGRQVVSRNRAIKAREQRAGSNAPSPPSRQAPAQAR